MGSFSRLGIWAEGANELEDVGSYIDVGRSTLHPAPTISRRISLPSSSATGVSVPPSPHPPPPPPPPILPRPLSMPIPSSSSHHHRRNRPKSSSSPNLRSPSLSPTFLLHHSQPPAPVPVRLQTSSLVTSPESPFHARSSHPHLIPLPAQPSSKPIRPALGTRGSSFGSYSSNGSTIASGSSLASSPSTASSWSSVGGGGGGSLASLDGRSVSWEDKSSSRWDDRRGKSVGMERKRSGGKEKDWGDMGVSRDSLLGLMERGRGRSG
ncbi:hypothetical protein BDY24DRAFT_400994 [Mrakia frigida]|uniref:uncharacterized protein n=1 Tax=Mrakia frigida TaxID=29902 RepID=UPI003FCC142F